MIHHHLTEAERRALPIQIVAAVSRAIEKGLDESVVEGHLRLNLAALAAIRAMRVVR